jgi:F-type H+-transporting ATPase subunit epsilon
MLIEIVTPDKNIFSGEVSLATFPGSEGLFGIMENHAPMVATLKKGKIKVVKEKDQQEAFFEVKGGVVEVNHNKIIVLAE